MRLQQFRNHNLFLKDHYSTDSVWVLYAPQPALESHRGRKKSEKITNCQKGQALPRTCVYVFLRIWSPFGRVPPRSGNGDLEGRRLLGRFKSAAPLGYSRRFEGMGPSVATRKSAKNMPSPDGLD